MKFDSSKLARPKRPNYFNGKLMTADDFQAEQDYQRDMRWLHNRMLHGYGIVVGLEVGMEEAANGATQITVSPGYALDGWGREIVLPEPVSIFLPGDRHDLIIYIKYTEQTDDDDHKTVAPTQDATSVLNPPFSMDGARVLFEPSTSERAIAPTTRPDYAISLARLRRPHQHWQRDPNFRPARAK